MSNFKNYIRKWDNFDFDSYLTNVMENDVERVLSKAVLNEMDFLTLLSPTADKYLEQIATKSNKITVREFGRTIQVYTPLYLSNYCTNKCIYCGFNTNNNIKRSKLSYKEMELEGKKIRALGIKHILLLTGGDRVKSSFSYIKESVIIMKKIFDSISIEVYSLSSKEYKELCELGVDNVTVYQETYNRDRYKDVHLAGEKRSYDFRIEAPERAAESGARSVNLGALLGLFDPVEDFFKASLHCYYIRNRYHSCDVAISIPRIKECAGDFKDTIPVDDKMITKFIMAYRLFIPRGGISVSTRESTDFRNNLLPLGVTKMSAESKTAVGGHSSDSGENQFETSDKRSVADLDKDLRFMGYQPLYKDWEIL